MLLNRQNPILWFGVAWCPGGRTIAKAFWTAPVATASAARSTPPVESSAISKEAFTTEVS